MRENITNIEFIYTIRTLTLHIILDIALKKAKALLAYSVNIQAMSHSFQDTFRESTIYALLGCLFLAFFFIETKFLSGRTEKNRKILVSAQRSQ